MNLDFYNDKTVFITGHTGFKGSWMCKLLTLLGANVVGYSLAPSTEPNLFHLADIENDIVSIIGDVRNLEKLKYAMLQCDPDIAIHMAAQPIVRASYNDPVYTYSTNVMGTVNFFEAVRGCTNIKSVINVTTDKVYLNNEWEWGYRESDQLNGFDPYSNSKSCSELVTSSYINSFFNNSEIAVSTCRAGNVIGGGDFAPDRIIPDCIRAVEKGQVLQIRNPYSTRPYQHVLEPIYTYLTIAKSQYENPLLSGCYNIGPDDQDCVTTGALVDLFSKKWGGNFSWENISNESAPHEANFLKLDCSKIKTLFNWKSTWHIEEAIEKTVEWSKVYLQGGSINQIMELQIKDFLNLGA